MFEIAMYGIGIIFLTVLILVGMITVVVLGKILIRLIKDPEEFEDYL